MYCLLVTVVNRKFTDNLFVIGVGSFLDQSVRASQVTPQRKDLNRVYKDSPIRQSGSLFKSSAIAPFQQPEELSKSTLQVDDALNTSVKPTPALELENMSAYVRLDHVRIPEHSKKVVPKFATIEIPLSRSLMQGKFGVLADAALFHNRRSRTGWGPDLQHLKLSSATQISLLSVKTSDINVHHEGEDLFTAKSKNPYVALLATYKEHIQCTISDDVPMLHPSSGSRAMNSLKSATKTLITLLKSTGNSEILHMLNYMGKVWNLCIALWGPLDVTAGSHAETMMRKERLTHWLEEAAMETSISGLNEEEEV